MKLNLAGRLAMASGLTVLATGLFALPALAEGYADASGSPQIAAGREVDGSAYLAGNNVNVAGTVKGDLFCAGSSVTISGVVDGDVLCAGDNVSVSGRVGGNLRLAGNTVTVTGATGRAATIGGNSVSLAGDASVGSDLTAGGNTLDLAGSVGRDLRLGAGTATVAGTVSRDVDGEVEKFTVTSTAAIGGHLHYVSSDDASVAPGTVQGEVRRTDPPQRATPPAPMNRARTIGDWFLGALVGMLGLVVLSLTVVLLLPRFVRRVTDTPWRGIGIAALIGLLTLAAILPITVILFVTIVGAGAGLLLVVGFPLALLLSGPLTAYYLGREIMRRRTTNMLAMVAVGAALLGAAIAIPFLGFLVGLAAGCVGLGLIVLELRNQFASPTYAERGPLVASQERSEELRGSRG